MSITNEEQAMKAYAQNILRYEFERIVNQLETNLAHMDSDPLIIESLLNIANIGLGSDLDRRIKALRRR